jgi:hypothetical protein
MISDRTHQLALFVVGDGIDGSIRAPTADEIEAAKTPRGGWTHKQLTQWGVGWPPRRGWKRNLIEQSSGVRP